MVVISAMIIVIYDQENVLIHNIVVPRPGIAF